MDEICFFLTHLRRWAYFQIARLRGKNEIFIPVSIKINIYFPSREKFLDIIRLNLIFFQKWQEIQNSNFSKEKNSVSNGLVKNVNSKNCTIHNCYSQDLASMPLYKVKVTVSCGIQAHSFSVHTSSNRSLPQPFNRVSLSIKLPLSYQIHIVVCTRPFLEVTSRRIGSPEKWKWAERMQGFRNQSYLLAFSIKFEVQKRYALFKLIFRTTIATQWCCVHSIFSPL